VIHPRQEARDGSCVRIRHWSSTRDRSSALQMSDVWDRKWWLKLAREWRFQYLPLMPDSDDCISGRTFLISRRPYRSEFIETLAEYIFRQFVKDLAFIQNLFLILQGNSFAEMNSTMLKYLSLAGERCYELIFVQMFFLNLTCKTSWKFLSCYHWWCHLRPIHLDSWNGRLWWFCVHRSNCLGSPKMKYKSYNYAPCILLGHIHPTY
jgi:hypothetical protein